MTEQQPTAESWMNGAAIILSDGREIPITDTMVRDSLEKLAHDNESAEQNAREMKKAAG
ncbi:PA1571 family protein [Marinobacter mangrovi]|uniref:PA1571 family protein n=1 Tax=Marinobacter TaxID=2742 RepID=UPI00193195FC|nr:PA1571 family protein [Marinobacter mangrovi]